MRRDVFFLAALALLISAPLSAQEDRAAEFVYEAYYAVDMGETEQWNRQYREYSVPILSQLVEEGVIEGFNQMQHQTGGDDYNYRFVIRTVPAARSTASTCTGWMSFLYSHIGGCGVRSGQVSPLMQKFRSLISSPKSPP